MTGVATVAVGVLAAMLGGALVGIPPGALRFRPWRRRPSTRRVWLAQAGLALSPFRFWAGSTAVGIAAFLVLSLLTGAPIVAVVPAGALGLVPLAYFGRRRVTRLRAIQACWPDGLRDLLASIGGGRSLTQALTALASSGPEPLREAFGRFPALARMLGTVPALEVVREELADPTSDRVIEVLILAHERGGNVVRDVLVDLVSATTKDSKVLEEIDTEGLEMRINTHAVLVLPWLVLIALTIRPGPFRDFYRSGTGVLVIALGVLVGSLGAVWVKRLGRTEIERRVLGARAAAHEGA